MLDEPRKIKLYGHLAEFTGTSSLDTYANTVAECIQCLIGNYPKLENYMLSRHYKIIVDEVPTTLEELHAPAGRNDIKIIPVVAGASGSGLGQIIFGAALIGLSFITFGGSAAFSGMKFGSAFANVGWGSKALFGVGSMMVLGGVSQMLAPTPPAVEEDPDKSFGFNSPMNVSMAGVAIPVLYGERIVGSHIISAGITVMDN